MAAWMGLGWGEGGVDEGNDKLALVAEAQVGHGWWVAGWVGIGN